MDIQGMIWQLKNAHVSPDDGYIKVSPGARDIIIAMLELLKEQPHWIPISERNPHTSGTYIVAIRVFEGDDKYILSSACYFDGSDTWYNDNRLNHERPYVNDKIIAWMSLPEPPKDGEQDGNTPKD